MTLAATKKLVAEGRIGRDEPVVVCITGSGLKTVEALEPRLARRCAWARPWRRSRPCCRSSRPPPFAREDRGCQCSCAFPRPSAGITGGTADVYAKGKDIGELVDDLERQFPGLRDRLCDETGDFRKFINVYVNQEDVRFLQGRETLVKDGDEVSIVPAIAGGR